MPGGTLVPGCSAFPVGPEVRSAGRSAVRQNMQPRKVGRTKSSDHVEQGVCTRVRMVLGGIPLGKRVFTDFDGEMFCTSPSPHPPTCHVNQGISSAHKTWS